MEQREIRQKRLKFLRLYTEAKATKKPIFFQDESYMHQGYTTSRAWCDTIIENDPRLVEAPYSGLTYGYKSATGKGARFIMSHIGSKDGFVPGVFDLFRSKHTGDYHEDMDSDHFETWFLGTVVEKLPQNSVVVFDNASYHSRLVPSTKPPTKASKRAEMEQWLQSQRLPYDENLRRKEQLYNQYIRYERDKDQYKHYTVDEATATKNIQILRLPPYHCCFNPIEFMWATLKKRSGKRNTEMKMANLESILREEVEKITNVDWQNAITHCEGVINSYCDREGVPGLTQVQPLVILRTDSDSDDSNCDSDSSDSPSDFPQFISPDENDLGIDLPVLNLQLNEIDIDLNESIEF